MINLGCFSHCDEIVLKDENGVDINAPVTGEYKFRAKFNKRLIVRKIEIQENQPIKISASNFNEDSYFIVNVYDAQGASIGIFTFSVYVRI
ncbi:hypothetical protein WAF17_21210 [Bernardetia sp. ABR2-2B]|uniref:hypothetical protein n=1 Tax=Bernardetia sp. ABR2-2B TaxID=3127472 RepID=UPI0030CEB99B